MRLIARAILRGGIVRCARCPRSEEAAKLVPFQLICPSLPETAGLPFGIEAFSRYSAEIVGTALVDCFGVAGLVLANLVAEKIVNGVARGRVGGFGDHPGAAGGFLLGLHEFRAQTLHRGRGPG